MATRLLERGGTRSDRRHLLGALRRIDVVLLASTFVLTAIGIVMIYSATRTYEAGHPLYFVKRQLIYALFGGVAMLFTMFVDYRRFEEWAWVVYGLAIVSLIGVRVLGSSTLANGSQREISLKVFTIQPSEFAVLAVIVAVAMYVHRHEEALGLRAFAKLLLLAGFPMLLIYAQPDLGTTLITGVVVAGLLLLAGFRMRLIGAVALSVLLGFYLVVHFKVLHSYQLGRLSTFLHEPSISTCLTNTKDNCYQLAQSQIAIGAGGLRGTGLLNGAETNNGYVPYAYADFIFSAIGEQLGFIGSALVLGLYALVGFRLMRAMQIARDSFGRLVCGGTLLFIAFSVFQNVGMTIGLMPITGIPLPFISFGGSALVALYAAVGLVVNIEFRRSGFR